MQFVKQQATIWRLQAEMDPSRKGGPSLEQMTQAPLPEAELARVRDIAKQELALRQGQNDAERGHLQKAVTLASSQIDLLKSRQGKDNENVQVDSADYEKLKEFSSRGNVPMTRLSEARRLYLFSATQSLQTEVQLTHHDAREGRGRTQGRALLGGSPQGDPEPARRIQCRAEPDPLPAAGGRRKDHLYGHDPLAAHPRRGLQPGDQGVSRGLRRRGRIPIVDEDAEIFPGDTVEVALHTETPLAKLQD